MKKRICPDCETRELEKRHHYCSECGEARRYIAQLIYRHNWRVNNPDKYKAAMYRNNNSESGRERKRRYKEKRIKA